MSVELKLESQEKPSFNFKLDSAEEELTLETPIEVRLIMIKILGIERKC